MPSGFSKKLKSFRQSRLGLTVGRVGRQEERGRQGEMSGQGGGREIRNAECPRNLMSEGKPEIREFSSPLLTTSFGRMVLGAF